MRKHFAFAIFLDGVMREHTVRPTQQQCRWDYMAATNKHWPTLYANGFRVRKVRLVPVTS